MYVSVLCLYTNIYVYRRENITAASDLRWSEVQNIFSICCRQRFPWNCDAFLSRKRTDWLSFLGLDASSSTFFPGLKRHRRVQTWDDKYKNFIWLCSVNGRVPPRMSPAFWLHVWNTCVFASLGLFTHRERH